MRVRRSCETARTLFTTPLCCLLVLVSHQNWLVYCAFLINSISLLFILSGALLDSQEFMVSYIGNVASNLQTEAFKVRCHTNFPLCCALCRGASWGDSGYIFIERGSNQCGISTSATLPTIIGGPLQNDVSIQVVTFAVVLSFLTIYASLRILHVSLGKLNTVARTRMLRFRQHAL